MAISHPTVVATATLTFGSDVYKMKTLPADKPVSCDAIDVTCCDDGKRQFAPGALTVNGEISTTIAGNVKPTINAKANLTLTIGDDSVTCGPSVVKSVKPADIEAGGNREATWDVVFQPCGSDPASASS